MPGLPVYHQLLDLLNMGLLKLMCIDDAISGAIQPSHPLLSPSPTFNLSQHQGLFKLVSSSHQVAQILEFQL